MEIEHNNYTHAESNQTFCRKLKEKSTEFAYNTSAHGIPKIGKARSCCPIRSGWTVLYIICLLFLFFNISHLVVEYIQYPIRTHTSELFHESLDFPGVTLCNLNPYKRSTLKEYTANELIHECTFNEKPCNIEKNFITTTDAIYGNCFTFKPNPLTATVAAGPANGLYIVANVNTSEYLPTTEAKGIRVTVHSRNDTPFSDVHGYNVPTGFLSSFRMRMKRTRRLAAPFSDCIKDGKTDGYPTYTMEGCRRSCIQKDFLDECKCGDPRFPVAKGKYHCKADNQTEKNCLQLVTKKLASSSFKCSCKRPCEAYQYLVTYSSAVWPSESYKIDSCNGTQEQCIQSYRKDMAAVELFYGETTVQAIDESATYSFASLLADLLTQFVIWVGISFFTLCEFVIFGVDVILTTLRHPCQKNK